MELLEILKDRLIDSCMFACCLPQESKIPMMMLDTISVGAENGYCLEVADGAFVGAKEKRGKIKQYFRYRRICPEQCIQI